ncbi:matrix metalloproteinase-11, partial [Metarhizium majus ARSEF 297]
MAASTSGWRARLAAVLVPRPSFSPQSLNYFNPSATAGIAKSANDCGIFEPPRCTELVLTTGLSVLVYLTKNKVVEVIAFSISFKTVHSAVNHSLANFQHQLHTLGREPSLLRSRPTSCTPHSYRCVTEQHAETDPLSAQIGFGDHVPRWAPDSVLTYVICTETFPSSDDAAYATNRLTEAIHMWMGVGATFKQVKRDRKATFRVVYRPKHRPDIEGVLANAFLPNGGRRNQRTLHIYALAFADTHVKYQANILAHEIGHILGLRHVFAMEREREWSATWMNPCQNSVMDYYPDSSLLRVQQQDLEDLKAFYDSPMTEYQGKPVIDFVPRSSVYPSVRRQRKKKAKRVFLKRANTQRALLINGI